MNYTCLEATINMYTSLFYPNKYDRKMYSHSRRRHARATAVPKRRAADRTIVCELDEPE